MSLSMALLTLVALVAQAQTFARSANPVSDSVREQAARAAKTLAAAAELMPADKYGYHPTEPQMTFGQLMVHVVQTNFAICSGIADTASPIAPDTLGKLPATTPKATLLNTVKRSFDFCREALSKVTDASLAEEISIFGRRTGQSRAAAMVTIVADWADHYSTAASYLRQNGVLPPTARPAK